MIAKTGQEIKVARRVLWQSSKQISKDAVVDMSAQFFVNFIITAVSCPKIGLQ